MGAPNLNPERSPGVEGVLNASQGSLVEVNPENEGYTPLFRTTTTTTTTTTMYLFKEI